MGSRVGLAWKKRKILFRVYCVGVWGFGGAPYEGDLLLRILGSKSWIEGLHFPVLRAGNFRHEADGLGLGT